MLTMKVETNWENGTPGIHARAGMHKIVMDEAKANGGDDLGANPMQHLLSSLGGCFIGIGRMIAEEMRLELGRIRCRVEGDIDRDGLLGKDPNVRPGCQEIRIAVEVQTDEPAERVQAWLGKVEARCPVKDIILNPTPVIIAHK